MVGISLNWEGAYEIAVSPSCFTLDFFEVNSLTLSRTSEQFFCDNIDIHVAIAFKHMA